MNGEVSVSSAQSNCQIVPFSLSDVGHVRVGEQSVHGASCNVQLSAALRPLTAEEAAAALATGSEFVRAYAPAPKMRLLGR